MEIPATADEVRRLNSELDDALLAEADRADPAVLTAIPEPGEWSLAQLFAHLGEFPTFFAGQLRTWQTDRAAVVGRTLEHPVRLAAVDDPTAELDRLVTGMRAAFTDLAGALATLEDADIEATTHNTKYGDEPLTAFLDRYVIGHKAAHLDQIQRTAAVTR